MRHSTRITVETLPDRQWVKVFGFECSCGHVSRPYDRQVDARRAATRHARREGSA